MYGRRRLNWQISREMELCISRRVQSQFWSRTRKPSCSHRSAELAARVRPAKWGEAGWGHSSRRAPNLYNGLSAIYTLMTARGNDWFVQPVALVMSVVTFSLAGGRVVSPARGRWAVLVAPPVRWFGSWAQVAVLCL